MKKVLVVDDCVIMREMLRLFLDSKEFDVVCYPDALSAENSEYLNDCYAIVSDYNMPEKNGYDFVRGVRESNKDVVIVMATANRSIRKEHPDVEEYVDSLIMKPYLPSTIADAIRGVKLATA